MNSWYLFIHDLADTVQPTDVGLRVETADDDRGHGFFGVNQLNRVARWAQPITYVDIHECDSFTVSFSFLVCKSVRELFILANNCISKPLVHKLWIRLFFMYAWWVANCAHCTAVNEIERIKCISHGHLNIY